MFLALAAMGLASCNGGYQTGESGILYRIYTGKTGPKIKEGDFVTANIIVKNDADSIISNTYEKGGARPLLVAKSSTKGDVLSALPLLSEGDSATIKVSVDSIFKSGPKPPIFKGKYITYTVKIEKLIPKGTQSEMEFETKVTTFLQAEQLALKNAEPAKIKKYIGDKKLNVAKTDSGLYYTITQKGTGPLAIKGDLVVVNYTGSLLNGKVFDTNIKEDAEKAKLPAGPRPYMPVRVPLGKNRVMAGWEQGLLLLNKGAKATLIIPSSLAYGEHGNETLDPFTPLVFNIEVIDIMHSNGEDVDPTRSAPGLPPAKK
ncbi:MAG: hypothetical protein JWR23_2742 [Mucilaginibacter sp.]|nr:hypothetical protein [Mucilaginibacter sp.]